MLLGGDSVRKLLGGEVSGGGDTCALKVGVGGGGELRSSWFATGGGEVVCWFTALSIMRVC